MFRKCVDRYQIFACCSRGERSMKRVRPLLLTILIVIAVDFGGRMEVTNSILRRA